VNANKLQQEHLYANSEEFNTLGKFAGKKKAIREKRRIERRNKMGMLRFFAKRNNGLINGQPRIFSSSLNVIPKFINQIHKPYPKPEATEIKKKQKNKKTKPSITSITSITPKL